MKKIYLFGTMILTFVGLAQGQFTDNIDSYTTGDISPQSSLWRTWSGGGGAENGEVTTEQANSAPNSMKIGEGGAQGGPQDQLLLFDNQPTNGSWDIEFNMFVPSGNAGYFNIQGEITTPQAGSFLSTDINFNQGNASPGVGALGTTGITFSFPHDEWFNVIVTVDLDGETYSMLINDAEAIPEGTVFNAGVPYLGGVDFFATEPVHTCYFDDIEFRESNLSVDDIAAKDISIYPNPGQDRITITTQSIVDQVRVIDILGKVVLQKNANQISPTMDISSLSTGTYIVQVIGENGTQATKLIKQ